MSDSSKCSSQEIDGIDVNALEAKYREALAAFKNDKSNKDLRRAKTAAKRAWDAVVNSTQDGEQLTCRDCSQSFMFTSEEEELYNKNCWAHRPTRCKICSEKRNSRLEDRTNRDRKTKNMCYAFQQGTCEYGDRCKFSHDPNGKKKIEDDDSNDDEGTKHEISKKAKQVTFIAKCKWGSKCTLKKCRFSHESDGEDAVEIPSSATNVSIDVKTTQASSDISPIPKASIAKKKKSKVAKAMAKALKKTSSKQLKLKELRKLIKTNLNEKSEAISKNELKSTMDEVISASDTKFMVDGKMVKLLQ